MESTLKKFDELSLEELYSILRLRSVVFVKEQDCAYIDLDNLDQESWHIFSKKQKEVVAYARIVPPGLYYTDTMICRVVTSKEVRGEGYGKFIVEKAISESFGLFPDNNISIMAQTYLIKFYEEFGFVINGEEFLEDGIPHIEMLLSKKEFTNYSS